VVLRDGATVHVRRVIAEDEPSLRRFLEGVSPDSLYQRFFGVADLEQTARSFAAASDHGDFALVAGHGAPAAIVAHAAWFRIGPGEAEVACLVTDDWQGRGVGSLLVSRLAELTRHCGIATLVAEVRPGNRGMIAVFERTGCAVEVRPVGGVVAVRIDTTRRPAKLPRAA